jgi:hypothetical protein
MTDTISRAAVLAILRSPKASDTFPDMISRVEALEGAGVRVKPLVWTKVTDESYRGDSLIGRYYAYKADGFWRTYREANGSWVHPKDELSLVAAQAAAQADYEARILAALEPMEPKDE